MAGCDCQQKSDVPCTLECGTARSLAFDEARSAWPEFRLTAEQFDHHLENAGCLRVRPTHATSLYLCAGCTLGVPPALRALDRVHLRPLGHAIERRLRDRDRVDDVLQEVRRRLLVGPAPKIATYRGVGSLGGWLRVIANNAALDNRRNLNVSRRRSALLNDDPTFTAEQTLGAPAAPDEAVFRARCESICEQALRKAIFTLRREQRHLLRLYFVAGASIDTLGQLYDIDRSTAARRIQRSLSQIREQTQALLAAHFGGTCTGDIEELLSSLRGGVQLDPMWLRAPSFDDARRNDLMPTDSASTVA